MGLTSTPTQALRADEALGRVLSASPNGAHLRLGWLGGTRGRASVAIAFIGPLDDPGWTLTLEPLLEVHNSSAQSAPIPYEFWRGRLALELGHRWVTAHSGLSVGLRLEHESDHRTEPARARGPVILFPSEGAAFTYLNDVAARVSGTTRLPVGVLGAALTGRAHFATCTRAVPECEIVSFGGVVPDGSLEVFFDGAGTSTTTSFAPYAALAASIIPESDRTLLEPRLDVTVGVRIPTARRGSFLFALALQAGAELGALRENRGVTAGGFIGWAP